MKLTAGVLLALGVAPFAQLASTQATDRGGLPSISRDAVKLTRFSEEDVTDVGVGDVHPIGSDEKEVEQDLVDSLEAGGQTTVVGHVELGELLCGSLVDAPDATLLRFSISSTETVIAQRTSYSTVDGSVMHDGKGRKLWMGEVVDPEPPAGSVPRTISMTWTDPCDVESFLLKVVYPKEDDHTSVVRSVPCAAGSSTELCMVELDVVFDSNDDPVEPELDDPGQVPVTGTAPPMDAELEQLQPQELQQVPSHRKLQGNVEIDVLVLYTDLTFATGEETQLLSYIVAGFSTANEATANSGIDLQFNLVRVDQLPYSQATIDSGTELYTMATDADVHALRDEVQADLVLLVGSFPGTCGLGYIFNGFSSLGYSLLEVSCFDNHSHTHEMAHNLGCYHDRANSGPTTDYSHGYRYCTGADQYRTIMAYANGCNPSPPRVNYFSNPDVNYLGLPTGTATDDNARTIEDNMVAVSNFRTGALTCADIGEMCNMAGDCCSDFCGSAGVCANEICDGAGGSYLTIGDSVCDSGNNISECEYDGGDCCACDCVEPACGGGDGNACTAPGWHCEDAAIQTGQGLSRVGDELCPGLFSADLGDCDYFGGATCVCTCVETGGDPTCGTSGYDCIDPDSECAFEVCGAAGGTLADVGNGICQPENNIEACSFDGGDCCSCDCVEPLIECGPGDDACADPIWSCIDSPNQAGQGFRTYGNEYCPNNLSVGDLGDCDYFGGRTCDCTCVDGAGSLCGTGAGFDCQDPASTCGATPCETSAECTPPEQCCPVKLVCEVPDTTDPLACGDPHMTGFRGQTFDFTGEDGEWYCLISDSPSIHLNMRVTTPVPSLPEITYITGLSFITTDTDGLDHSVVIAVANPHSLQSACPAGVSPCLADGALEVFIDGSEGLLQPGSVSVGPGVSVSGVNLPGGCRSFGFDKYWERKKLEYAQATGRRLNAEKSISEWILSDPTATNMAECMEYVAKAAAVGEAGLFEHQSEHSSFRIVMPTATIRLSHGRLHQLPMRDPTDRYDLPDHTTWQMNMAIDRTEVSLEATGILGETLVPTLDDSGTPIMQGIGAIRGSQEDYRVEGPLGVYFTLGKSD
eukprot:g3999.t1